MRTRLAALAVAVFVAVVVTWARDASLGTLRVDNVASLAQRLWPTFLVGVALVVAALSYERVWRAGGPPRRSALRAAIALHVVAALALPLTSNDVFSNLAYGRLAALGHNPYLTTPDSLGASDPFALLVGARWRGVPIAYGPIVTRLDELVALSGNVLVALLLFKLAVLAAVVASLVVAERACRSVHPAMISSVPPARAASSFALYAFSPVILWELSAQAHNDALLVLSLIAFVAAASREREGIAVVALALGVFAKFAAAPVLALYLACVARRSVRRALLLLFVALAVGGLLAFPYWGDLNALRGPMTTLGGAAPRTTRSFVDLLYWCVKPLGPRAQHLAYSVGWWLGTGLVGALGLRALVLVRTFRGVVHQSMLVYLAYCLVGTPWFQPWYVTWILPLAMAHDDVRWQRVIGRYAALTPIQYILPLDPLTTIAIDVYVVRLAWPLLCERAAER